MYELLYLAGGYCRAEEEALCERAAVLAQEAALCVRLDAFCEWCQAKAVCELDDGGDERCALLVVGELVDERPVDLEDGGRELDETAERRVAGTEVVDGERNAEPA